MNGRKSDYKEIKLYSSLFINSLYTIYNLKFDGNYKFFGESHDFWELGYIISGSVGITSGDKVYECEEGNLFLHRPGAFHTSWANKSVSYRTFIITFNGEGLNYSMPSGKFFLNDREKALINMLINEVPSVFSGYDINEYENLLEVAEPNNEGYQIIKNYVELLCLSLKRRGKDAIAPASVHINSQKYTKVVSFLKEHINDNLSLTDISQGVSESPSSLKAIFRQFAGGGIMKYYNYLRCQRCMQLICDGHSLKEITHMMNFSSQAYFSYFFKHNTGILPSDYLKNKK